MVSTASSPQPTTGLDRHFELPAIRRVGFGRPFHWLALGWEDIARNPSASFAHGLLFAFAGLVLLRLTLAWPYLFTTAVFGFLLAGPLVAAGVYEISRQRERQQRIGWRESLRAWRNNGASMGLFAAMLALTAIAWERISAIVFALFYGGNAPNLRVFLFDVFLSGRYVTLAVAWLLTGAVLAAIVFCLSAIAAPILVDRDVDAASAMATSMKTMCTNPATMVLWAALIVVLVAIGFATMLVGMIVILPLLGHATWHAYKEMVE